MPEARDTAAEAQAVRILFRFAVFVRESLLLKLLACVVVDAMGMSTYLLPGVGELGDLGWAPLQALYLWFMFGSVRATAIGVFEELGPGTDLVPTATLCWCCENVDADVPALITLRNAMGVRLRSRAD